MASARLWPTPSTWLASTTEPGTFVLRVVLASVVTGDPGSARRSGASLSSSLVAPVIVAHMVVRSKGRKRQEAFAAQLPDVLQLLIASLRSGFSLPQAFDAVVAGGRRAGSL